MAVLDRMSETHGSDTDNSSAAADFLVAGLPGPLSLWVHDLVAAAVARRYASVVYEQLNAESAWTPAEVTEGLSARVFFGDFINDAWREAIQAGRFPTVLVIDEAAPAFIWMQEGGHEPRAAMRVLISVATSLGDLGADGRVLLLSRADCEDQDAVVTRILAHIGQPDEPRGGLVAEPLPSFDPEGPDAAGVTLSLPEETRSIIAAALDPARHYGTTGERVPVIWSRDCLYWGDHPGERVPRVLDLTGPSRLLVYGPYYHLAPGFWRMSATLAISPSACGMPMNLELYGATELARFEFSVDQPGLFAASMPVYVPSGREPLECRLVILRGAIEGTLGLDQIEFVPVQPPGRGQSEA